ncbi:CDK-activating kinase assembly factor MAT1-like [Antedon mediterranea]|uniref:CDK-activating kinase assembly factor MAT1-like n=1 Tax=Antedon mediterranea TaxID=105859 RepID=UPI003AF7B025
MVDIIEQTKGCPRCKTTKYLNPSLKLMVNVCGHSLCENCVSLLFSRQSGVCPQCNTALRRNQFRLQHFEDAAIEKDIDIRRRILKDFNKQEDDFDDLREYNDYLEMVETIIYNLVNGIDTENTKKQVEAYRRENKELISKNRTKYSRDITELNFLVEQEKVEEVERNQRLAEIEISEKNTKKKSKEALLNELTYSKMPASQVISSHMARIESEKAVKKPVTQFSTGAKLGGGFQTDFMPITQVKEPLYVYEQEEVDFLGPAPPDPEEIETEGFMENVRSATPTSLAGGYTHRLACQRALQEAFSGLFFFPAKFMDAMDFS